MNTIVLATNNPHKAAELRRMIENNGYQVVTLSDIGYDEPPAAETGKTYSENAELKAKSVYDSLQKRGRNYIVVAEDSGLEIDALDGAPGIKSARFCGTNSTDRDRRIAILEAMEGAEDRSAKFECHLAAHLPGYNFPFRFRGKARGEITTEERGESEFGYDNIFSSHELQGKTFGEATTDEKDSVSHRGKAVRSMLKKFIELRYGGRDDEAVTVQVLP